jgi:hypothetical protein
MRRSGSIERTAISSGLTSIRIAERFSPKRESIPFYT